MPSLASSFRIRGAPHVTFDLDIFRIRSTSSRIGSGDPGQARPRRFPALLCRFQKRLNPSRCHRITVAGWTIASAYCHPAQYRASTIHSARSQSPEASRPVTQRTAQDGDLVTQILQREVTCGPKK